MKCTIPEISWHNREPVLSVDIHPIFNDFYRLATGGGDCHVLIWQMILSENGAVKVEVISDLTRHQRAINSVRWSPTGQYLATADDDANIIVWQLKTDNIPLLEGETNDKEIWTVYKIFRGHKEDIYDLCWSIDGTKLFSGSVDNTAIIWDLSKGKLEQILPDHKGFVQGVTWDPKGQFLATISTDRICRIFDNNGKQVKARIHKGFLPVSKEHYLHEKEVKYFHDDTFKSFFRRLQFSPDGSLLIVPSGHVEVEDCKKIFNATFIFTMDSWAMPAAILPLPRQCSTVVRCCPILFELREEGPDPIINLPYRMIVAIGTDHDVILYDTQQTAPFARLHEIHYTRLTDLTWSHDGLILTASSTDGFCALITFEPNELGTPYVREDSEVEDNNVLDISGCEELEKDENVDINNKKDAEKVKKPSFLEKWALNTPNKKKKSTNEKMDVVEILDDNVQPEKKVNVLTPKRIKPIKIGDVSSNKIQEKTDKSLYIKVQNCVDFEDIVSKRRVDGCDSSSNTPKKQKLSNNDENISVDLTESSKIPNDGSLKSQDNVKKQIDSIDLTKSPCKPSIEQNHSTPKSSKKSNGISETSAAKNSESQKQNCSNKTKKSPIAKPIPVRRKPKETDNKSPQVKNNSLLNFLNKSSPKSVKDAKDNKTSTNTTETIDLVLDENEARDAWKCENIQASSNEKTDNVKTVTEQKVDVDDCTEDFCLQLEDTQSEKCDPIPEKNIETEKCTGNKNVSKNDGIISIKNVTATTSVNNQSLPAGGVTKKRIPLITLSSPKSNKKRVKE